MSCSLEKKSYIHVGMYTYTILTTPKNQIRHMKEKGRH